jgi:glycerol-3-phosphate acyltransferase PlsY
MTASPVYLIGIIVGAYLLGSIPFGLVLTRLAGLGDIRQIGSGNIGATNVLRTGNKPLALLTLFLDGAKGTAAVLLTHFIAPELAPLAGLATLTGHLFPVWLKFKGGKGVATAAGIFTALYWPIGLSFMVTWILVAKLSHYSSLAALVAIGLAPAYALFFGRGDILWLAVVILVLVFIKHGTNIKRLKDGTEPKIGKNRNAAPQA